MELTYDLMSFIRTLIPFILRWDHCVLLSCSRSSMEDLPKWEFEDRPKTSREKMPAISIDKRSNNFDEVELGYDENSAALTVICCFSFN